MKQASNYLVSESKSITTISYQTQKQITDITSLSTKIIQMSSNFGGLQNQLNQIAQTNIGQFKLNNEEKREIKVVNLDAVDFTFPLEPITLYMFNPFGPSVLVKVLNNLVASLNENPRTVWIVYYNSKHTSIFDSFGVFKKLFSDESPKYNRTWLDNSLPYTVYYADGIKN